MATRSVESDDGVSRRKCQERSWDFARELRSLRDSCARSRTEEMQALRRSSEEVERCVLRRQLDESAVLQDFLAGLHEDIESRLEGLHTETTRRLDLLEDRMTKAETEGTRVTLALEVQRAVSEAFSRVERSADAARRSSDQLRPSGDSEEDTLDNLQEEPNLDNRLHRVALKLVAAGEESARRAAREVAMAVATGVARPLEERLSLEAESCQHCQHRVSEMAREAAAEAEVVKHAVLKAEAASGEVEQLRPWLVESLAQLAELQEANDASKQLLCNEFREACELSRCEEMRSAQVHAEIGRLEESLCEALSRNCSEAIGHAREAHDRCEVLEQSLIEETKRSEEGRVRCSESAEAVASLGQDLETAKENFLEEQKQLRMDLIRGQRELSNELKPQLSELTSALMRGTEEAQKAVARCDAAWRPEVQDLRKECQSSLSYLRSQAAVTQKSLEQLEVEKTSLLKGLRELQRQGVCHEWRLPRLQQRLEYLSMDSKECKGVWIDSPEFELAGLGPFVLRFYPRGVSGSDGLCAVGVFAANRTGRAALPLRLDLRISDLRKRASAQSEADGVLWLAHSFSTLESLKDELLIGVDIPPFAWSALDAPSRPEMGLGPANPFCKTADSLPSRLGRRPMSANSADPKEREAESLVHRRETPKAQETGPGCEHGETQGHRSVPNSPHGSSSSTSRPGWAAFGGEELPKRPFSAHVPRSCVSQPMPVLLGSMQRRGGLPSGNRGNPFANERSGNDACGNPFDK